MKKRPEKAKFNEIHKCSVRQRGHSPWKRFQVDFEIEFLTEHHDENDCEKIICQVPCFNSGGFLLNIFRLIRRLLDRRQCDQMLKKQPFFT